jgi:hypothetical protein
LYDQYEELPNEESLLKITELERKEEEFIASQEYTAFGGDTEKLKAVDFHNEMDESFHIFDCCQAGTGNGTKCGTYMPSYYYEQANQKKWKFRCCLAWPQVVQQQPSIEEHFVKHGFGEDMSKWPPWGCGAKFRPWRNGPSKVVEFKVITAAGQEEWVCFMAARLPQELDDEIKVVQEHFHRARGRVTAAEILEAIPVVYPVTNAVDPKGLPGVSKWNYALWKSEGQPHLSQAGWRTLCLIIAKKDPVNLAALFTTAEIVRAKLKANL